MDDEKDIITKDYKEEFDKINDESIDEYEDENINEEIIEDNDKDTSENKNEKKPKNNKKIILIIITILLLIACITCMVIIVISDKKDNNKQDEIVKIQRPSNEEDYTILKQSYFNISCKHNSSGEKYRKLTKGLIIDCVFTYELNSNLKVNELYFDLDNSTNVKLKDIKNESDYELLNDEKTYKLSPKNPDSVLENGINFYFEVINENDDTGYVEISNIVFKDENNKYYKVVNSIDSFPPEYDDKIYIYKGTYEDDEQKVYYYSSKIKNDDLELFDTFQCKSENCETKTEANNYFLINDEKLLVYDTLKKTTITLKTPNDFKVENYTYEFMSNSKGNLYGIAFKKDYKSAYDCQMNEFVCINTGLSGYEIGYYSIALDNFSIALDYGFIGSSAFNGYDVAMMLKKDNKIGIFSYEDDNMMLEFSDKYKTAEYDDNTEAIKLEVYDNENKEYYFEYFNPKYSLFTLDTDKLQKYNNSNIYYTTSFNSQGKRVTMLFDNNGNAIKNLPYVISDNLISVTDTIIVKDNYYKVYDLKGNLLYTSKYNPDNVLAYTNSFIVTTNDNKIVLLDINGKELANIKELKSGVEFISAEEKEQGILTLIIKDDSINEKGKNAYKYTIEINKPFQTETIHVD